MIAGRPLISRALLVSAVAAFAFPIYAFAHWVMVFDANRPREEVLQLYYSGFPYTWRSPVTIVTISVIGCVAAIILAKFARPGLPRGASFAASVLMLLAAALGAWNLFTMM